MASGQVPGPDAEPDGMEEALETSVRLAVTAGARIQSEIGGAREERLREQRRLDERETQRLAERFEVEKSAAVAELCQVHRADWWELAGRDGGAERIGQTYATAVAWAAQSDEAARAERTMRQELRDRYDIDLDRPGRTAVGRTDHGRADRADLGHADHGRAGLDHRDVDRTSPLLLAAEIEAWRRRLEEQREREAKRERRGTNAEQVEAAVLLDQAAVDERRAAALAGERSEIGETSEASDAREPVYDSAERRVRDRHDLEKQGIATDLAASRIRGDIGFATPATHATAGSVGRRPSAPKARRTRSAQLQLPGMER